MLRFLILLGYFELSMYLNVTGKLDRYINMHYAYLAYISMVLSFILAVIQLIIWVKKRQIHSHLMSKSARLTSILLLSLPLAIGLFFPTVTLNSETVSAKGYNFPTAASNDKGTQEQEGTTVQYLKPDTSAYFTPAAYQKEMTVAAKKYLTLDTIDITRDNYMEVMELIYDFPDQFLGKTIRYTGFVYKDPQADNTCFIFRFGVIHCIADSGVYGLATTGITQDLANDTWVTIEGSLDISYHQALNQSLPTLTATSVQSVSAPDNPYVYRVF